MKQQSTFNNSLPNIIILCSLFGLSSTSTFASSKFPNMNFGNIYSISNPNQTSAFEFSTNFSDINAGVEYFDVYSPPISSRYGEVYWTMMDRVDLPEEIVERFNNKTIAIVGYETNQVFHNPNDITGSKDISVPITWSYNHHYEAWLLSSMSRIQELTPEELDSDDWGVYNHGAKQTWKIVPQLSATNSENIPLTQFFSEGNGGESRGSFHGYASNMAQLLYSPTYFHIQPMQIDTRNRDPKYINQTKFHPGILPKATASPVGADYSGLLECPCTTRINKTITKSYSAQNDNKCHQDVEDPDTCYTQARIIGGNPINNITRATIVSNNTLPSGCTIIQNELGETTNITFNTINTSVNCGVGGSIYKGDLPRDSVTGVGLYLEIDSKENQVFITLTGPSSLWYGVAFNADKMADLPYTIVVNGTGYVNEIKLGDHSPGTILNQTVKVVNNTINNQTGLRTIVLSRTAQGLNLNYYSFNTKKSTIPILTALGNTGSYGYHHLRSSNTISLRAIDSYTCICYDGTKGSINGIPFSKRCAPEPTADLLQEKNPTCWIETYQGGLSCCHHKNILLDLGQEQPEDVMTYQIKFRFWFQEYQNHLSLVRLYFQTEAWAGEYDIPKCLPGTPSEECVHGITARWKARDMLSNNEIGDSNGVRLAYAGPHCHAPSCISMELYNADTGVLLCRVLGNFGQGRGNVTFDEKGYIKLNPCVWGYDEGLLEPPFLSWDTNLMSIKKNNNTNAHYGEMASWQMRGFIV